MPKRKPAKPRPKPRTRRRRAERRPKKRPCSLRAFARLIGKSHTAVEKAVTSGRLSESIGRDAKGEPFILDKQQALEEWEERGLTLSDAQRRATLERARSYKLANLQKQGALYPRARAKREAFECARTVRDAMLNLPNRLSAELAAEADPARVFARLDEEIRKALAAAAEVLSHEPSPPPPAVAAPRGLPELAHART